MKYIIFGGGIAGLYTAYKLVQRNITDIWICEQTNRLGGRVNTKFYEDLSFEYGAGVIGKMHTNVLKLVEELGLNEKLIDSGEGEKFFYDDKFKILIDIHKTNFYKIINFLTESMKDRDFKKMAINYSLYGLIEKIYDGRIAEEMMLMFGYDGDFLYQNSVNGVEMFNVSFTSLAEHYVLKGGLIQIINELMEFLKLKGVKIFLNTSLIDIVPVADGYVCKVSGNQNIFAHKIILAINKPDIMGIPFLSKYKIFDSVDTKSLMRIYAIFPIVDGHVWFEDLRGVVSCDSLIRKIVPINKKKGLIMICYVDDYNAKNWFYLKKAGVLGGELMFHVRKLFKDITIPDPVKIFSKFHEVGTHMYKPTFDSTYVSDVVIDFLDGIYIVGEAYSKTQQWMEGAIESVNRFILKLHL